MRIISGKFSGRLINAPSNLPVRPTTDYAKSALFNILNNRIDFEEIKVLDLFAGIGGVSMEFISRGAKHVTSVDLNFKCCAFIKETASKFDVKNISVIKSDVFKFIKSCDTKFDIIFADAPFELQETDLIPDLVFERDILTADGILIVEHQAKRILQSKIEAKEIRKYGNCAFSLYSLDLD